MLTPEQAQSIGKLFTEMVEREYETTRKVLAAVPDDQLDFKLGEKGRTARELMWHIANSEVWFAQGVVNGNFEMEERPADPAAKTATIVGWYQQNLPPVLAKVKELSGEQLATPVNFYNVFNLPAVFYVNFWNSHSIHHRGQLSAYLRAMNAHVPGIYGGSADEPFEMPATAG